MAAETLCQSLLLDFRYQAGIEQTMVYRSSFSEGWHLYIFFEEAVSSKDLSKQLNQLLKLNDFEISKGTLEVFPQPGVDSNGQGLRLPLQEGFAWLDQKTLEVENERFEYSATSALELFIDALNGCANNRHQFHQLKAYVLKLLAQTGQALEQVENHIRDNVVPLKTFVSNTNAPNQNEIRRVFQFIPPGINAESWVKGRGYYTSGLTGPSQRADAIFCLGHYLFYGDPESRLPALGYGLEQERKEVIKTILSEKHYGNSQDLNRDRADAIKQVERATAWMPPARRLTGNQSSKFEMPVSWRKHNANLKVDARLRIELAVKALINQNKPFSVRDLQTLTKCSQVTLYKHQDLWKTTQSNLRAGLLATVTHEYNAVGQSVSLETVPLVLVEEFESEFTDLFQPAVKQDDDLSSRRSSKLVESWITPIQRLLPKQPELVDSSRLVFLIPILNWFLSSAPTVTCNSWLSDRLETMRALLRQRVLDFRLISNQSCFLKRHMCNRYPQVYSKQPLVFTRRLSDNQKASHRGNRPPPT